MTANLTRLRERFDADAADRAAFDALEEHYFVAGDWTALIALYEAHLAVSESRPAADRARLLFRMGQAIEEGLGDTDRAVRAFRESVALDSNFVPAVRRLRALALATGGFDDAIALALRDAQSAPVAEVAGRLADIGEECLARDGDAATALRAFEEAIARVPEHARALRGVPRALERLGRPDDAVAAWQRAAHHLPARERIEATSAVGALLAGPLADLEGALLHFQSAAQREPGERRWVDATFDILMRLERYAAAASLGPRRLEGLADPAQRAAIAAEIGRIHLDRLQAPAEARAWLERAVADGCDDAAIHLALAEAASRSGDAASRTAHLERAMELGAEIPAWSEIDADGVAGAPSLDALRRTAEDRPGDGDALAALAARGEHAERVAVLERRAEIPSLDAAERAELWFEIGEIRSEPLRDPAGAVDAYRRAIAADPERGLGSDALESALRALGRLEELPAAFAPLLEAATPARRAALLCRLGSASLETGDIAGALAQFEAALDLDPASARALAGLRRAAAATGDDRVRFRAWSREAAACDAERLAALGLEALERALVSDEPEIALPVLVRWTERAPSRGAWEALASLLEEVGRTDELAQALAALDPHLAGAERAANRRRLGYLHAAEGRGDEAIDAWHEALRHDPRDLASFESLVAAYAEAERDAELCALVESRGEGEPRAPRIDALYAAALERLGRLDDAAARLRACVTRGAADDDSVAALERLARQTGSPTALADALGERTARMQPTPERDRLRMERAELFDRVLDRIDLARELYDAIERDAVDESVRDAARARLDALLERTGAWAALCERLESRATDAIDAARLHERIAEIAEHALGDPTRARRHLERVVALDPGHVAAWRALASLSDGEPALRLQALTGERRATPDGPRAVALALEMARLAQSLGDVDAADAAYRDVLAREPAHEEAFDFVASRLESGAQWEALAERMRARLAASTDAPPALRVGQRARLAALLSDTLERHSDALSVLEPARSEPGALAVVGEPLARLYQLLGRSAERAALCEEAAEQASAPPAAARWWQLAGEAWAALGDDARAAQAFRRALGADPGADAARAALVAILRSTGDDAGLVALLEQELCRPGADALALHSELALRCAAIGREHDACTHALAAAARAPHDESLREPALARALAAERLAEAAALLRAAAEDARSRDRASLWRRCGELLAATDPCAAELAFETSLSLDPEQPALLRMRRELLEALGRSADALVLLEAELAAATLAERAELVAHGADLAFAAQGAIASRPWLARLAAERPEDPALWCEIARRYGVAGDVAAQERSLLEAERRCDDRAAAAALACDRGLLLERAIGEKGRALVAYETALALVPSHPIALTALERLYTGTGRSRERLPILERRAALAGRERGMILERAARCAQELGDAEAAARLWWSAVEPGALPDARRDAVLPDAVNAQRRARRRDAFVELAEQELRICREAARGDALRRELASAWRDALGRADRALVHLRAIARSEKATAEDRAQLHAALRSTRAYGELAASLADEVALVPDSAAAWRELAELRESVLWDATGAEEAWRALARIEPRSETAWAGLRRCAQRRGDAAAVATALEREIEIGAVAAGPAWRELGRLRRDGLRDLAGAERAFAAAAALDPGDLEALAALRTIAESRGEWSDVLAHASAEIAALGEREPARRREIWLLVADIAASRAHDLARAADAYERADALGALPAPALAAWAGVLQDLGAAARWRAVFARWCDHAEAKAQARDHLALATALAGAGERDAAEQRLRRVFDAEPESAGGWVLAARLREARGDAAGACAAWTRAGRASIGLDAARALRAAAGACEPADPEQALSLLGEATRACPSFAPAHAALALLAERCGRDADTLEAATSALDLDSTSAPLPREEHAGAALAGARAAVRLGDWPAAWRLSSDALALAPDAADALLAHGLAASRLGSSSAARRSLEAWLECTRLGPECAPPLAVLGDALAALGATDEALERYDQALAIDPRLESAHAGRTALFERCTRVADAATAFAAWAEHTSDAAERGDRFVAAARLAVAAGEDARLGPDAWLCAALEAVPDHPEAWLAWTERLAATGRHEEALAAASEGAACVVDPHVVAALELRRARTLEARGDDDAACAAYRRAAELDPTHEEAVWAASRLLRRAGDWASAADCLGLAGAQHPDRAMRAAFLAERGQLLGGPLEDLPGALEAYRQALSFAPERIDVREALAGALAQSPASRTQALGELISLLGADPVRPTAWRRIASLLRDRGDERGAVRGLALLRALGAAARAERHEAPDRLDFRIGGDALDEALGETLRQAMFPIGIEWSDALAPEAERPDAPRDPALAAIASAWTQASADVAGPALARLGSIRFAEATRALVWTALGRAATVTASPETRAAIDRLPSRALRRLRRALADVDEGALERFDFEAWAHSLQGLALALAVDRCDGDLRGALTCARLRSEPAEAPPPEADLTPLAAGAGAVRDVVSRAVAAWLRSLERRESSG